MKPIIPTISAAVLSCASLASLSAAAAPPDIKLPAETAQLKPSSLPGYAIASQKCGICHSADYVEYQPPNLTVKQWTGEMAKMQHAYGAPISDDDVKLLGVYLAATYGDATSVTADDRALKPVATTAAATGAAGTAPGAAPADKAPDVQALLAANGCLACHAIDRKVFGPAYHDVAVKYKADPQALAHVTTSIQQGGAGKWGQVPMPAFPNLGAPDATALAQYVLKQ